MRKSSESAKSSEYAEEGRELEYAEEGRQPFFSVCYAPPLWNSTSNNSKTRSYLASEEAR